MQNRSLLLSFGFCVVVASPLWSQERGKTDLAAEAHAILKSTCYRCHGQDGTVEGGFSYVLSREQLISRGQVIPKAADRSRLIRRIKAKEMPPEGETPELSSEQMEVLIRWVDAGAPDFDKPKAARRFIDSAGMLQTMIKDLAEQDSRDRKFIRYLTLTHLYNAGRSDDELRGFYHGITKLVNSLSWGRKVVLPKPVGTPTTIFRIDIRDYKWSAAVWDKLAGADPYALSYSTPEAKKFYADTGSALPYVRGDWFVAAASRPPLYHEILQLPQTDKELESLLHVDVGENIRTAQAARAGFNGSAVSRNNRMIERHDSSYGYYWKSYDFAKNVNRKNLFAHPLGPGKDENLFLHDGGELIFSLPNGFQGYMLVDAKGQRIDKGPTEIVSDPKQPDRAVENGLSCMSCHVRGILPKSDQIRPHAEKNPNAFSKPELEQVLALYSEEKRFEKLLRDDAGKFREALEQAEMPPSINEPIQALATLFDQELDLSLAAAEAGVTPDELKKLLSKSTGLSRVLGNLQTDGGTVQRETFANSFATLARTAKQGTPAAKTAAAKNASSDDGEDSNAVKKKPAAKKKLPKGSFASKVIELTDKANPNWILKQAKAGTPIESDKNYVFAKLPKQITGGTLVLRDSGTGGWLPDGAVTALKDCKVYAIVRTKYLGKVEIDEVTFTKFAREGWEEVDDEVKTTFPPGEGWQWKALSKEVSAGDVFLPLETINWPKKQAVFFIFQ